MHSLQPLAQFLGSARACTVAVGPLVAFSAARLTAKRKSESTSSTLIDSRSTTGCAILQPTGNAGGEEVMQGLRVRATLFVATLVALTGCATQAQRQAQAISTSWQSISAQVQACVTTVQLSEEAAPIRRHTPLKIQDATLQQLTDPAKATDDEIAAIYVTHPKVQECRSTELDALSRTTPIMVPVLVDLFNRSDQNLIALLEKKITWGEGNQRQKDLFVEAQKSIAAAAQQINASLQQSHEAELARRQAAANALAQWAAQQQTINALTRPRITNCNAIGNTVNCVSQ